MMIITNDAEYQATLDTVAGLMDAVPDSPEMNLLLVLSRAVCEYEEREHPISTPDPVDAILFRMAQMGWRQKDVSVLFGGPTRASEVLNRKRPLTKHMILAVHRFMGIPLETLLSESSTTRAAV
jgi:HTH-type transcriptional regulator/antitoxin HigA